MKRTVFMILIVFLSVLSFAAHAAPVGKFSNVSGRVDLTSPGVTARPVHTGDEVNVGDIIRAKSNSKAEIIFVDDSILRIAQKSRVAISDYTVGKGQKIGIFNLFRGKIENVVKKSGGLFGYNKKSKFEVHTSTAVCGVRGTDFFSIHQGSLSNFIFKEGTGYGYTRNRPKDIVIIRANQAMMVINPDLPPIVRRAKPEEISRHSADTDPGDRDEDDEGKKDDTRVEKPADDKSRDREKGDDKAKEEKSGDNEGKDQKRVDGERKDGKPGDDKPSDRRSDDRESGDYKPGDNGPGDDGPGNDRREDYGPGDNGPGDDRRGDYGPGDDGRGDYGPPPPGDYGPDDYQGEGPPPTGGDYGPYGPPPPGGEYGPSEYGPSGDMSGNPGPGDYGPSGDMRGDFGPYGPPSQGGDYGPYGPPPPGGDFGFYGPPPPGGFYGGPGDFGPGGFGPGDFNMGDFGPGDFYMGDFGPGDFFHPDIGFDISDYLIKPFSVDSIGISGNSGDSHFSLSMSGKYNQTPPFMYMYENIRGALTGSLKSGYFYGFTACGWNPSGQTVDGTAAFFYIGSDESGGMMGGDVSGSYSTDLHDWNASSSLDWVQLSDPGSLIVPGSVAGITDYARDIFIVTGSGSGNFYQSNTDIGDFNIYKSDGIFDSIQEDQYWGFWQTHTGSTYLTIAGKTLVDCDDWFLEWEQKGWETTDPAETQNLYLYMSAKGTIPNYKRVESTDVAGGWVDIKHAVTGIAIGELDGGYNPSESEIFAGGGGVWLETSQLLTKASTAGGRADLVKLDIPSVTVGTANLAYNNPGGAIITNVTLTGVTFLSYASDQAPRLWATGTVTGTNVAAPTAGTTTVNLSGNNYSAGASALIAKFNVTAWDTSENPDKWTATITDGTGTVNSKSITFKGGAGGEIDSPTAFSGTAAGWAK